MIGDTATPLPAHPLENLCLPSPNKLKPVQPHMMQQLIRLLEVYVDDFISLIQAPSLPELQHYMHAILHAIHKIFPLAMVTQLPHDEPIALKKLSNGNGLWATTKEILGWVFDVITQCISLPAPKVDALLHELQSLARRNSTSVHDLQRIQGQLIHAAYGIPNGKALLSQLMALIAQHANHP